MQDVDMNTLLRVVMQGLSDSKKEIPLQVAEYYKYKDAMHGVDGVLMCRDRILILPRLREGILDSLHSEHHEVEGMDIHAQSPEPRVIWPGIT